MNSMTASHYFNTNQCQQRLRTTIRHERSLEHNHPTSLPPPNATLTNPFKDTKLGGQIYIYIASAIIEGPFIAARYYAQCEATWKHRE
ncbi:hypothetical protein BDW42DRAFT_47295 [Aspergillus taichungensis]|uniref:Uncharacterized protein n=1 Tax=Aspergillus taichungensis TaxID=482145 RepID=A0A2J5HDR7_9EURO|nr:hypothetical protein BDW42DRAFT_47295 [Aspergillus taichungensis]